MIGIVLVSANEERVNGLLAKIEMMISLNSKVRVLAVGRSDSFLGISPLGVLEALACLAETTEIFIFCDSTSSQLSVNEALELLTADDTQERLTFLPELPLVLGAYLTAIEGASGRSKAEIMKALAGLRKELEE